MFTRMSVALLVAFFSVDQFSLADQVEEKQNPFDSYVGSYLAKESNCKILLDGNQVSETPSGIYNVEVEKEGENYRLILFLDIDKVVVDLQEGENEDGEVAELSGDLEKSTIAFKFQSEDVKVDRGFEIQSIFSTDPGNDFLLKSWTRVYQGDSSLETECTTQLKVLR